MIQIIGLIVAVYALLRCVTIPLEMAVSQDKIAGVSAGTRYLIACGACAAALAILLILTVLLVISGQQFPTQ